MIGAAMVAIGPLLPWVEAGMVSASGLKKSGGEAVGLMVLGLLAVALLAVGIAQRKKSSGIAVMIVALLAGGWSMIYYKGIGEELERINAELGPELQGIASIGAGLYLCLAGAVVLIIGGAVMYAKPRK